MIFSISFAVMPIGILTQDLPSRTYFANSANSSFVHKCFFTFTLATFAVVVDLNLLWFFNGRLVTDRCYTKEKKKRKRERKEKKGTYTWIKTREASCFVGEHGVVALQVMSYSQGNGCKTHDERLLERS